MRTSCKNWWFGYILACIFNVTSLFANTTQSPVSVQLISEQTSIAPGDTFWVLVHFSIEPGWHLYWKNPGDAGAPPQITWHVPEGFATKEPLFPTPKQFHVSGTTGFGYTDELSLLVAITASRDIPEYTNVSLNADITFVACKTECIPGKFQETITLPIATPIAFNSSATQEFATARKALPQHIELAEITENRHILHVVFPLHEQIASIQDVQFFPLIQDVLDSERKISWTLHENEKALLLSIPTTTRPEKAQHLSGILVVTGQSEDEELHTYSFEFNTPIVAEISPTDTLKQRVEQIGEFLKQEITETKELMTKSFFVILSFAFLGGMILNLMPCVLPVVSIKLVHYIKLRNQSYLAHVKQAFSFASGILIAFWILAGIVIILQAAGKTVGWGFQLQEPIFVTILAIIMFILAMSFFGVFEFGLKIAAWAQNIESTHTTLQEDRPPSAWSAFLSGLLATCVATPCTGPLLGSALGFTVSASAVTSFFIFTALGLGMSFPYVLLSLIPGATNLLPKPGRWMITFKQLMGFLMLLTVVWLVWVLTAEVPLLSTTQLLSTFFVISTGLWVYGTWGGVDRNAKLRAFSRLVAIILVGGASATLLYYVRYPDQQIEKTIWQEFSVPKLNQLKQEDIVFVNFTAKWCLTCQANALVFHSPAVKRAFKKYHVVTLQADWTDGDPEITNMLHALGRNGVPVYAIYPKGSKEPILLPELLTPDIVVTAIEKASTT